MNDQINNVECNCLQKYIYNKPDHNFRIWIRKVVNEHNTLCQSIQLHDEQRNNLEIANLPRCLLKILKKECKCDKDCLAISILNSNLDKTCKIYGLDGFFSDTRYLNCSYIDDFQPKKVNAHKTFNFFNDMKLEILYLLAELCNNNPEALGKLKCNLDRLRDMCENHIECVNFAIVLNYPVFCINRNYDSDVSSVFKIIKYGFEKNLTKEEHSINKRTVSFPNNEKFDLVYLDNLNINDQSVDVKKIETDNVDFNYILSFIVISTILLSLVCINIKEDKIRIIKLHFSLLYILLVSIIFICFLLILFL